MMPLTKLATIFCRPKPTPTPIAPEKIASDDRLMPTAAEHDGDGGDDQQQPHHLDQQHLQRRRQVARAR